MGKESIEQGLEKRVIPICLKNVGTISNMAAKLGMTT